MVGLGKEVEMVSLSHYNLISLSQLAHENEEDSNWLLCYPLFLVQSFDAESFVLFFVYMNWLTLVKFDRERLM